MGPTIEGFKTFIYDYVGIPAAALPDVSPAIQAAYDMSIETVNLLLTIAPLSYTSAVYNLGTDLLINYAQDVPPSTYFADARLAFKINSFVPGVVNSASDNGTSTGLMVPDFFKDLTLSDLQHMKTPWGRAYLAIAQKTGTLWGVS